MPTPDPLLQSVEKFWLNQAEALGSAMDPWVALKLTQQITALIDMAYQMGVQDGQKEDQL